VSRIDLEGTMYDALLCVSEKNPGALSVLAGSVKVAKKIDPDNWAQELGLVVSLDGMRIYGSDIWRVFKELCEHNLVLMMALCRANQYGLVSVEDIRRALDRRCEIDVRELHQLICIELEAFQKEL